MVLLQGKQSAQMKRPRSLTHFSLKNQKWAITFPSRYCSGAGEIFVGLPLAGRQAVVGCVPHKEYFHFLARCSIAEIPKTMAN